MAEVSAPCARPRSAGARGARWARRLRAGAALCLVAAGCGDAPTPPGGESGPVAIMFWSQRPEGSGLHLMSADGRRVVSLARLGPQARTGDWSPDGRRIAFTEWDGGNFEVGLADADGSGLRRLTASYRSQEPR